MISSLFNHVRQSKALLALVIPIAFMTVGCNEESKAKKSIVRDVESQIQKENEKLFGKDPKGIAKELANLIDSKRDITVSELKLDGDKASGTLVMKGFDKDDVGGFVLLVAMGAGEMDRKKMSISDVLKELHKDQPRAPASVSEFKVSDVMYKFAAKKEGGEFKIAKLDEIKQSAKKK